MSMHKNHYQVRVEFGDCDPAGIIHYPAYFDWFDRATWRLFESAGFPREVLDKDLGIGGLPLVEASAKFLAPVRWGDDLTIESSVRRWGRSSFDLAHLVFKNGTLCVQGFETRVWSLRDPDAPERIVGAPVPENVREKLGVPAPLA
jgi:4-hydroxybenzoyl-CoA thioesterase